MEFLSFLYSLNLKIKKLIQFCKKNFEYEMQTKLWNYPPYLILHSSIQSVSFLHSVYTKNYHFFPEIINSILTNRNC